MFEFLNLEGTGHGTLEKRMKTTSLTYRVL